VTTDVTAFVAEKAGTSAAVVAFFQNKAVKRQYHTWFGWEDSHANTFFGLFGAEFKSKAQKRAKESEALSTSIRAFLEVGNERNKMVHQDFATFALEKTVDEIYQLYLRALPFVDGLGQLLRECDSGPQAVPS
jgi:hypothetical protein